MHKYKYQLHTHTSPCSACGKMSPAELCDALRFEGFSGAVLTNHFIGGNSGIDRTAPWKDFVGAYERDYLDCKEAAAKKNVDIIFGVEEGVGGGIEILAYGLTPEMLYCHEELKNHTIEAWSALREEYGILIIQAHPFRNRSYNSKIGVLPLEYIDGIEVLNSGNTPENDELAAEFAKAHPELIFTSGADAHKQVHIPLGGIKTPERITDEKKLVEVLKSKDFSLIPVR